jgi:hypothetical protein
MHLLMRSNRSFDADTRRQCAAKRAGKRTPRGALPVRAGQLQLYASEGPHRDD